MKIPDEISLISFFECEPQMLDEEVMYYYNQATYEFKNNNGELFIVSISPADNEFKLQVLDTESKNILSLIELSNVESIEILSDKKQDARFMITSESSVMKIDLKPRFRIFMNQFLNN